MGRSFVLVNERAPGVVFFRFQWLWDAAFWLCVRFGPTRRLTQRLVRALGSRGVLAARQPRAPGRDRLRLPDDDRGARRSAPRRAGSTSRSSRRSPTSRRCTTGPRRASTCTCSRIPSRSEEVREVAGDDTDVAGGARAHPAGVLAARATRARRARRSGCPPRARSCSSRAAAGASATSRARSTRRSRSTMRGRRVPVRPQRGAAQPARGALRRSDRAFASSASPSR